MDIRSPETFNLLGGLAVVNSDFSDGIKYFKLAIKVRPSSPEYWKNLANAYNYASYTDSATLCWKRAFSLDSSIELIFIPNVPHIKEKEAPSPLIFETAQTKFIYNNGLFALTDPSSIREPILSAFFKNGKLSILQATLRDSTGGIMAKIFKD